MQLNHYLARSPSRGISQAKLQVYDWQTEKVCPVFLIAHIFVTSIPKGVDKMATLPPETAPPTEIYALKNKLSNTLEEIRGKNSKLTVHDLRRLLFRTAATIIAMEKVNVTFFWCLLGTHC